MSNFKAIGQLFVEILHLKYLGDAESVVTKAVVLVLGACQMSIATYLMGGIKLYCNVLGNYNVMPL